MTESIEKRRIKFGKRIKSLRVKKGISLRQLASRARISPTYLSYIERGIHGPPSQEVVSRLTFVLEANLDELMTIAGYIDEGISKPIWDNLDTIAPALRIIGESKDDAVSATIGLVIVFVFMLLTLSAKEEPEPTPEDFYRELKDSLSEDSDKEEQFEAIKYFEDVLRLWRNDLESN